MRKKTLFLVVILLTVMLPLRSASAKTLTIAVIDTGIDRQLPNLCKFGHKSFVDSLPDPLQDENGHGTHIAGIIRSAVESVGSFCLVSIKYYSTSVPGSVNAAAFTKAIQYAVNIKADFINISGGGQDYEPRELSVVRRAAKLHLTIVAAAGNEKTDIGKSCNYYPACYDNSVVVVGNLQSAVPLTAFGEISVDPLTGRSAVTREPSSNYGTRITAWEVGTNVYSTLPGGRHGYMTGTSQATAVYTGKLARRRLLEMRALR